MSDSENQPNAVEPTPAAQKDSESKAAPLHDALQHARELLRDHPLAFVAAVAAGVALAEFELAAGILLGIGASTLLSTKSGNEIRQEALEKGKQVLERARQEIERRKKKTESNGAQSSEQQQPPAEQTKS